MLDATSAVVALLPRANDVGDGNILHLLVSSPFKTDEDLFVVVGKLDQSLWRIPGVPLDAREFSRPTRPEPLKINDLGA